MLAKLKSLISLDPASFAIGVTAGYLLRTPIKLALDLVSLALKL